MADPGGGWWSWVRGILDKIVSWILTGNVSDNSVKIARFVFLGLLYWSFMMALLVYMMGFSGKTVILSPFTFQFNNLGYNSETSSSGRYVRYSDISGEVTKVYKGFDGVVGMGISWSKTDLTENLQNKVFLEEKCAEANMMKTYDADNIVKCYQSLIDYEGRVIHMITEFFPLGNLVQYLSQYNSEGYTAIKNWCSLLMEGIKFVHSNLLLYHCDINGDNMVITGKTARVVIGKFGFSLYVEQGSCLKHYGSYTFGMCILERVTREPLYSECTTKLEFLAHFKSRAKHLVLNNVTSTKILQVLSECLTTTSERSSI
ncbi:serine/threonine-protein kinase WNK8-like [Chenopodium quinoa]|uniref:serine/threonine-protein kinase WNK8-like n=1 Tax=Chenopodium quinoa TaxID=63459 RepID=UPI000B76BD83|nr:serine/threonine-protein kinase WNK8-like [Chenopodium quinoa]